MKSLVVQKFGILNQEINKKSALENNKIRVKIKYSGVGFADVMAVRGGYPLAPKRPFAPGYEFYGIIEEITTENNNLSPGQRVAGMLPHMNGYREYIDLDPKWVIPVPDEVSDEDAAIIPLNYLTALALIKKKANLQKGDSFLIHGAAGGVGTATLELARELGIQAYGTASKEKHHLVEKLGGIPIDYKNTDWVSEIKKHKPMGLNAVFDAFGGESLEKSWKVVAKKGILVSYGFSPTINGGFGPMLKGLFSLLLKKIIPNGKQIDVCGTPGIIENDPAWYQKSMDLLFDLAKNNKLSPQLHGIYPWNKVEDAHQAIIDRKVRGKILLDFSK